MKATFKELNHAPKFTISDRKENHFHYQYSAVCFNGKNAYEAVTLRIYSTDARSYCCLWVRGNCSWEGCGGDYWRNGSGHAGGYGYHRASAAAAKAIENAGIDLDEEISGRGWTAIENAVEAIARAMWGEGVYIQIVQANP